MGRRGLPAHSTHPTKKHYNPTLNISRSGNPNERHRGVATATIVTIETIVTFSCRVGQIASAMKTHQVDEMPENGGSSWPTGTLDPPYKKTLQPDPEHLPFR